MRRDWLLLETNSRGNWLLFDPVKGEGHRLPEPSLTALRQRRPQRSACCFQVLGHVGNAQLIVELLTYCAEHPDCTVVLVGPSALFRRLVWKGVNADRELFQHLQILAQICHPHLGSKKSRKRMQSGNFSEDCIPPSWHVAGPADRVIYTLAAQYFGGQLTREQAEASLRCHPAWPALRFLGEFSWLAAVQVLCDFVDVRWFASPEISECHALELFFGVAPFYSWKSYTEKFRAVSLPSGAGQPTKFGTRRERRRHLLDLCLPAERDRRRVDWIAWGISGRDYLWEDCREMARDGYWKGWVCRRFLRLLADSWRDGVALVCGAPPPRLCDAENCFSFSDKALGHWQEIFQQCLLDSALRQI